MGENEQRGSDGKNGIISKVLITLRMTLTLACECVMQQGDEDEVKAMAHEDLLWSCLDLNISCSALAPPLVCGLSLSPLQRGPAVASHSPRLRFALALYLWQHLINRTRQLKQLLIREVYQSPQTHNRYEMSALINTLLSGGALIAVLSRVCRAAYTSGCDTTYSITIY